MKQTMRLIAWVATALAVALVLAGKIDSVVAKHLISTGEYARFRNSQTLYSLISAIIVFPAFLVGGLIAKRYFLPITLMFAPIFAIYGVSSSSAWHGTTFLEQLERSWPSSLASVLACIGGAFCGGYLRSLWLNRSSRDAT